MNRPSEEHAQSDTPPRQKRTNRPCSSTLYPAYANIQIQRPGGRSHARPLVGRKGGVYFSGSGHLHTRVGHFSFHQKLGGRFCRSSRRGVAAGGRRRSRGDGWRGSKMASLLRCRRGSNVAVDAMWLAWWSGGGVVVEWWLSKIKKVKEKRYLKITSPMNHM